ncbi:MAG: peptidylprolyl isomerase [Cyanobacteriota bacterium]
MDAFTDRELARLGLLDVAWRYRLMEAETAPIPAPPPGPEVEQSLGRFLAELQLQEPAARQAWCELRGLQEQDLLNLALRPLRWQTWCEQRFGGTVETEYLRRKGEFDQVTYSLLRVRDADLAAELHQQIREGEATFADLAGRFSEGPEQRTKGVVGPVPLATPHPSLARLLQISQPGQLWPPKQLEDWWIIVRLDNLTTAQLDDPLRRRLMLDQGEQWLRTSVQESIAQQNPAQLDSAAAPR